MTDESHETSEGKAFEPDGAVPSKEDFASRVGELARATKERGMGQIFGYIFSVEQTPYGAYPGRGFILGLDVRESDQDVTRYKRLRELLPHSPRIPEDLEERWWYDHRNRQGWFVHNYRPPTNKWQTKEGGSLFRRSKIIDHEEPITYDGKHGERDWVQYTYFAHIIDQSQRPGAPLYLNVAVPPDIAREIDRMASENIYFPDEYLKALFPDIIGNDPRRKVKRYPANELMTIDLRADSTNPKISVLSYPEPIPF